MWRKYQVKASDILARPDRRKGRKNGRLEDRRIAGFKLDKLLTSSRPCGIGVSDAVRKIKQRAVKVNGEAENGALVILVETERR